MARAPIHAIITFVIAAVVLAIVTTPALPGAAKIRAGYTAEMSPPLRCLPFTKAALPAPIRQADPHATERSQLINEQVKSASDTILFFGDSLTEDWDSPIWEQHFAARGALNAGIRGDRTENLLWRLEHGNLDGASPKAVVLLIGTNDISRDRPPEVVAEGIRANLQVLRVRLPTTRILLLGVLPRSGSPTSPRRRQVSEVNRLLRNCADSDHVFYADIGGALLDSGGRLPPAISPDGVHLSERGYALLASHLDRELDHVLNVGR